MLPVFFNLQTQGRMGGMLCSMMMFAVIYVKNRIIFNKYFNGMAPMRVL